MNPQIPTVTATVTKIYAPDEMGGICYQHYDVRLTVGGHKKTLTGWVIMGWIKPGATQDLDGSALANWGSSQPGGWSVCSSDGVESGVIEVCDDDGDDPEQYIVIAHDGSYPVEITPDDVPEWRQIIDAGDDEAALAFRSTLKSAIDDALTGIEPDEVGREPEAETVFCDLWDCNYIGEVLVAYEDETVYRQGMDEEAEEKYRTSEAELNELNKMGVAAGNWRGAGDIIAWRIDGDYDSIYWPTRDNIRYILDRIESGLSGEMSETLRDRLHDIIKEMIDKLDS